MIEIFQNQVEFQRMLGNKLDTQEFRNQMFLGMFEEVVEVLKESPFKSHKKNQMFNRDNFVKELVDVQLYLINLLLSCDIDYNEFETLLKQKQQINIERQNNKY